MKVVILFSVLVYAFAQSNYGTEFYIGAMLNFQASSTDLLLYIMSPSLSPVHYTIESSSAVLDAGIVTNTSLAKVSISTSFINVDSSYSNRNKAIRVSSLNEGLLLVLVVNYRRGSIGEYLAYTAQDLRQDMYKYYAVSTGSTSSDLLSGILLVGISNNTIISIVPTQNITIPQDIQNPASSDITVIAGSSFSITLHAMQTFLFGATGIDISGTSIVSDKLITVISGHQCGAVPSNFGFCEHLFVQVPPTVLWGVQFLLTPYGSRAKQYYKIITAENETILNFTCVLGNVFTDVLSTAGSVITKSSNQNQYCSLVSNKPVLVNQLGPGKLVDGFGDPVISVIPPTNFYSKEIRYVSLPNDLLPMSGSTNVLHYINIVATSIGTVLMNGSELSLTWTTIYDGDGVIGYGTQLSSVTLDTVNSIESNTTISLLVHGFASSTGYSYSAGINIDVCSLKDNGGCEYVCVNDGINTICICDSGYTLETDGKSCSDTNECDIDNGGCEHNCSNEIPFFTCSCLPGFILYNQSYCTDINECMQNVTMCSQSCVNTAGSFFCTCQTGYIIGNDSYTCSDINECLEGSDNCVQICINDIGSFHCNCSPGFNLSINGSICEDITIASNDDIPLYYGAIAAASLLGVIVLLAAVVVTVIVVHKIVLKNGAVRPF